ncbi:MAG TPA: ATP-binding protein [Solirubrobacter sp.]|nr:ATP-binding protein [Solirubrobacter sp.]
MTEPSYRRLVEQVPAVVIVFALGRGLAPVYVSPQTQEILGVPANDWLEPPHPALSRIHADDRVLLQMKLAQQARGRAAAPAELRWKRPDGRELWLRDVSGVVMEDGRHLQAMLVDITEAKRAEAERRRIAAELQLAHKLEAVGRLAAGVAHEINTPVQALGDTVAFLQEAFEDVLSAYDAKDDRARREQEIDLPYLRERVPAAFERAAHATDRIAQIVRTMGEQTHPAAHAPADLNHVARAALALAGGTPDLEDELPPVTCDPGAIEQVLVNLLKNAHDAGGAVTLRTRASRDAVTISVSDTGPGIPPHVAERVFDPFFTTKDVGHGTGQGLAIARAIVDRHGGTLTFDSSTEGTTFYVNLKPAGASAVPA